MICGDVQSSIHAYPATNEKTTPPSNLERDRIVHEGNNKVPSSLPSDSAPSSVDDLCPLDAASQLNEERKHWMQEIQRTIKHEISHYTQQQSHSKSHKSLSHPSTSAPSSTQLALQLYQQQIAKWEENLCAWKDKEEEKIKKRIEKLEHKRKALVS